MTETAEKREGRRYAREVAYARKCQRDALKQGDRAAAVRSLLYAARGSDDAVARAVFAARAMYGNAAVEHVLYEMRREAS